MDRFGVLICLSLCASWHIAPAYGQSQIDINVMAKLENIEKQVIGHTTQLEVQSKLIAELQTKVTKQESLIAQHQETISAQQETIDSQQKTIFQQQTDIANQKSSISKQQRRLSRLERILIVKKTDKERGNDVVAGADTEIHEEVRDDPPSTYFDQSEGDNGHDTLRDRTVARSLNRRIAMNSDGSVAFHAVNTASTTDHVAIGQKIMFPTVMLNLGAGYHSQHGIFTAPRAGLYIFSTSIMSSYASRTQVDLRKNGAVLARAYAHGEPGHHNQGSVTIVTQLAIGDEVCVSESHVTDASYFGASFTSFMGYLLYPF